MMDSSSMDRFPVSNKWWCLTRRNALFKAGRAILCCVAALVNAI